MGHLTFDIFENHAIHSHLHRPRTILPVLMIVVVIVPVRVIMMMVVFIVISFVAQVNQAFWKLVYGLCAMLGVSSDLASEGYRAFRIW